MNENITDFVIVPLVTYALYKGAERIITRRSTKKAAKADNAWNDFVVKSFTGMDVYTK